jgi:hypothetical protein
MATIRWRQRSPLVARSQCGARRRRRLAKSAGRSLRCGSRGTLAERRRHTRPSGRTAKHREGTSWVFPDRLPALVHTAAAPGVEDMVQMT